MLKMWGGLGFLRMNKADRLRVFFTASVYEKRATLTVSVGIIASYDEILQHKLVFLW